MAATARGQAGLICRETSYRIVSYHGRDGSPARPLPRGAEMVSLSDQSTEGPAAPLATPGPPPAWPLWLFRIVVTIEAVLAFDQAVFAGQFISGDYGALNSHQTGATVTGVLLIVETLAAVALWRFGRGP